MRKRNLKMKKALIVVDIQRDFCEGGSLAVAGGNAVAEATAKTLSYENLWDEYGDIIFTKDWHKAEDSNGGHIALPPEQPDFIDSWPSHCIAHTKGSRLHPDLAQYDSGLFAPVFKKGFGMPAYSGFEGTDEKMAIGLRDWLKESEVTHVDVCGIAADYCVRATAMDAVAANFKTKVLEHLTVGIHQSGSTVAMEIAKAQS